MKTKDLIEQLNKEDPSGELECVVGASDIYFVQRDPMWYDGVPIILLRDKSKEPYYSIKGFKMASAGEKVVLHTMGAEDVLWDNPDCIVELGPSEEKKMGQWVFDKRIEIKRFVKELDEEKTLQDQKKIYDEDLEQHKFNLGLDQESEEDESKI